MEKRITNFDEFWIFYVREHANPLNRQLHFIGSSCGLICLLLGVTQANWRYIPLGFLLGYGFAWVGHFFIERNKPASFGYPLWSFRGDWKMWALMLRGKMQPEVERAIGAFQ
jgi:hypothetical protein